MEVFIFIGQRFFAFMIVFIIAPLLLVGFFTRGGFFINFLPLRDPLLTEMLSLLVLFTMIFNAFLKSLFLYP